MAVIILKETTGIYPAYNDSYIEFNSDSISTGNVRAEITAYPVLTFPKVFVIYPDLDGNYLFNFKEIVKVIFNENGFKDGNFDTGVFSKSASGLYHSQQVQIKILNDDTEETIINDYEFFKAVKQIGEGVFSNPFQLLSNTKNGVDHSFTYFEGFPFHFDIQKANVGVNITVKNLNTSEETIPMTPTLSEAFRINVDKGGSSNWTSDHFLPLTTNLNRLEIYEAGEFRSNLNIYKKKVCTGIYLKWWNRNGGFSHYLFDKFHETQSRGSDISRISTDDFSNIGEATGINKSIGKKSTERLILRTSFEARDHELLKDITTSPLIQMYTSRTAHEEGVFIDVALNGTIAFSNKRGKNEIQLTVALPEVITAKL